MGLIDTLAVVGYRNLNESNGLLHGDLFTKGSCGREYLIAFSMRFCKIVLMMAHIRMKVHVINLSNEAYVLEVIQIAVRADTLVDQFGEIDFDFTAVHQ